MRRPVQLRGVAQKNTVAVLALFVFGLTAASYAEDQYVRQREKLVNYLAKPLWGRTPVRDKAVLDAMRAVPRHEFVPQLAHLAYEDRPLPIGLKQTISQPYIVAIMSEALQPKAGHKILEIGTGSGYQAAVLAEIVDSVYTIEIVPELGKRAAEVLQRLEYRNVYTRIGDGYKGWKEHAPYDGIIVTAAPDHVPQPLVDQLKAGGRMVIPVGPEGRVQQLVLIEKAADGSVRRRVLDDVRFVPLTREDEAP